MRRGYRRVYMAILLCLVCVYDRAVRVCFVVYYMCRVRRVEEAQTTGFIIVAECMKL